MKGATEWFNESDVCQKHKIPPCKDLQNYMYKLQITMQKLNKEIKLSHNRKETSYFKDQILSSAEINEMRQNYTS